jgi:hypothetical protein
LRRRDAGAMAASCRCSECRTTFTAEPSARETQRVCGKVCRRRATGGSRGPGAAAISTRRMPTSKSGSGRAGRRGRRRDVTRHPRRVSARYPTKEVRQFVDRALERSRATLGAQASDVMAAAPVRRHGAGGRASFVRAIRPARRAHALRRGRPTRDPRWLQARTRREGAGLDNVAGAGRRRGRRSVPELERAQLRPTGRDISHAGRGAIVRRP